MKISVSTKKTVVARFAENLKLPENEQISYSFTKPKAYSRAEWTKTVASRSPSGSITTYIEKDIRKIILDSDVRIFNLVVATDGDEKQVSTGADLLEVKSDFCASLLQLIVADILNADWKDELKNLPSASVQDLPE